MELPDRNKLKTFSLTFEQSQDIFDENSFLDAHSIDRKKFEKKTALKIISKEDRKFKYLIGQELPRIGSARQCDQINWIAVDSESQCDIFSVIRPKQFDSFQVNNLLFQA